MLRESGVIKLPSQRTLGIIFIIIRISDDVDRQLLEAAKLDICAEFEKYVVLLMDKMHVKENLVYTR